MSIAIIIPVDGNPIVGAMQRHSNDNVLHIVDARQIATLGAATVEDLFNGPLPATELGAEVPEVFVPVSRIKYFFPVSEAAWGAV